MLEIDKISERVIETTLKITHIREESISFFTEEFAALFVKYGVESGSFSVGKTIFFRKDGFAVTMEYDSNFEDAYCVVTTRGGERSIGKESFEECINFVKALILIEEDLIDDVKECLVDEGMSIEAVMGSCGVPGVICANYIDDLISAFVVIPMNINDQISFFAKIR
jgi:hypothetical protein